MSQLLKEVKQDSEHPDLNQGPKDCYGNTTVFRSTN